MATQTATFPSYIGNQISNSHYPNWALASGDIGSVAKLGEYPDRTFQIDGTFGAAGSVTLRGSNKPAADVTVSTDWFTLHDFQGNALTFTSAAGGLIAENPLWVSPICTAGDGTTALNVRILGKR